MLSRIQLQSAAGEMGFPAESLEKVWMLVRLLNLMVAHPYLRDRFALKGGTALNLFVFDLPRLSVDIDVNYIGSPDRDVMTRERPRVDAALQQVVERLGLTAKRVPDDHAGGKWRLGYMSALGRPATLEVDVNYMLRTPLWPAQRRDSMVFAGERATQVVVLDDHELAAGKLAALLARGASRDLFDARALFKQTALDMVKLRVAFVVYGGINRVDWRTVSIDGVKTTVTDVKQQLLPMLRDTYRPAPNAIAAWTAQLIEETRQQLSMLLPLSAQEVTFLDQLNDKGEIEPALLTSEPDLQARIRQHPGLLWKALNVKKHKG